MKVTKSPSAVEEYKLVSSFESLRKTLLSDKFADRLDKPLAYWALPNDRRLPLAFLGRSLRELLSTPFDELAATPGIGQKKISSLMKLLSRATKEQAPAAPLGSADPPADSKKPVSEKTRKAAASFDPAMVSEALWSQWRETVRKHGLGQEKLGRLAPSLQNLPTVIWHTPLDTYAAYGVTEIRQLKTHGEKRVRVILEVFYIVHEAFANSRVTDALSPRLVPKFVQPLERWVLGALESSETPSPEEIREHFAVPLVEQMYTDTGATIARLVEGRLGISATPQSVRQQSRRMGVTRARVYQLLEDCAKVMGVRWPEGQLLVGSLQRKLQTQAASGVDLALFNSTVELFFPAKGDPARENGRLS